MALTYTVQRAGRMGRCAALSLKIITIDQTICL